MIAETHGTGGIRRRRFSLPYVYDVPASIASPLDVFVNCRLSAAMRAPGHPQGCAMTEAAMDDLADKLGMDPLEFRLKNLDPGDFQTPIYRGARSRLGAELIGWREKRKPRGQTGTGPIRHGMGMAPAPWGGGGTQDKKVSCTITPDGSVELKSATQDIGTGARTVLAIIAAEVLGLAADRHHLEHRQFDVSARPGLGRLDHDAVDGTARARRGDQGPRRALQEDRAGRQGRRRRPGLERRPALGQG